MDSISCSRPVDFHNSLQPWLPVSTMAFISQRRIDFPMVDLAKIVYYPRFWDLAHRFYEESWEFTCGMHYNEILSEKKIAFPLVHSEAKFLHPISYGDTVECTITVPRMEKPPSRGTTSSGTSTAHSAGRQTKSLSAQT